MWELGSHSRQTSENKLIIDFKETLQTGVGASVSCPGLAKSDFLLKFEAKFDFLLKFEAKFDLLLKFSLSLLQHDPDVDAIYRLTSTLPINFNTTRFESFRQWINCSDLHKPLTLTLSPPPCPSASTPQGYLSARFESE